MVTDMERIGDQSTDIADTMVRSRKNHASPEGLEFREMSEAVIHMVTKSIDAFVRQDAGCRRMTYSAMMMLWTAISIQSKKACRSPEGDRSRHATEILDLLMIAKYFRADRRSRGEHR
jgi:phosphate transport system protein